MLTIMPIYGTTLMAHAVNPYGDGLAASRTVAAIAHLVGQGEPEPAFNAMSYGLAVGVGLH